MFLVKKALKTCTAKNEAVECILNLKLHNFKPICKFKKEKLKIKRKNFMYVPHIFKINYKTSY